MAKSRRRARTEAPKAPAEPKQPRRHHAAIWLATLSTVVGIATGMFTLRDQVFPRESGSAQAVSVSAFQQQVGAVCDDLNTDDRRRARQIKTIHKQLTRAKTTTAQRNALLDGQRQTIARSGDALASFTALETPKTLLATDRAVKAAWKRNLTRLRSYAERLDRAATRPELVAALRVPPEPADAARRGRRRADVGAAAPRWRQLRPADADQYEDVPAPAAEHAGARARELRDRERHFGEQWRDRQRERFGHGLRGDHGRHQEPAERREHRHPGHDRGRGPARRHRYGRRDRRHHQSQRQHRDAWHHRRRWGWRRWGWRRRGHGHGRLDRRERRRQ